MRKTKIVRITEGVPAPMDRPPQGNENRDHGKRFKVVEMSAMAAERWAARATLALTSRLSQEVGPDLSQEFTENPGMQSMGAIFRILRGMSFPELEPLLDELMSCVEILPDENNDSYSRRIGLGGSDDIEEMTTLILLRQEVMELHTGFTLAASLLNLLAAVSMMSVTTPLPPTSQQVSPP
jgi:hypothetical protein